MLVLMGFERCSFDCYVVRVLGANVGGRRDWVGGGLEWYMGYRSRGDGQKRMER